MKSVAFALIVIAFLIPLQGSGDVLVCQGDMTSSVHYMKARELTIPDGTQRLVVQLPSASNATLFAYTLDVTSSNITYSKKPDTVTATEKGISVAWDDPPPKLSFSIDTNLMIDVSVDGLNSESQMPVKVPSDNWNISKYLSPSTYVQSQDREIANKSQVIINSTRYESAAVTSLMLWVSDNVKYDANVTTHDAAWTFKNKRGTCENYAHLSLALLRSAGIPARYVSGYLVDGAISIGDSLMSYGYQWNPGPHSWIEVYYPDLGWVPYEPQKTLGFVDDHHVREATGQDSSDVPNKLSYTLTAGDSRRVVVKDSSEATIIDDTSTLHVVHTSSASRQRVMSQEMAHGGAINDHVNVFFGGDLVWLVAPATLVIVAVAVVSLLALRRHR